VINTIIDIYHGNSIDLEECLEGGIIAIIHKATQGAATRDSKYHERRERAKALGFLWGAYHFSTGGSVSEQVENFLAYAKPEDDELISLDWESSDGPDMTLDQAKHFVQMVKDETGRWPVIYGGHLLRESIGHNPDSILGNCPLWYARYASSPVGIPTQVWPTYALWQYTDGDVGPQPHETPGTSGADRNIFQDTTQQLKDFWPFTRPEEDAAHDAGFAHILNAPQAAKKSGGKKQSRAGA
jgi:lysozyme